MLADMDEAEAIDILEEKGFMVDRDRTEQTLMNLKREKSFELFLKLEKNERSGTEITLYVSTGKEKTEL